MVDNIIYVPARLISQVTGAMLDVQAADHSLRFTSPEINPAPVDSSLAERSVENDSVNANTGSNTVGSSTYGG